MGLMQEAAGHQRGGEDPVRIIRQFAGRIRLIHLKDYRIKFDAAALAGEFNREKFYAAFTGEVQIAEVGEGSLPIIPEPTSAVGLSSGKTSANKGCLRASSSAA